MSSVQLYSTNSELPLTVSQIPSDENHQALNEGTWGGVCIGLFPQIRGPCCAVYDLGAIFGAPIFWRLPY